MGQSFKMTSNSDLAMLNNRPPGFSPHKQLLNTFHAKQQQGTVQNFLQNTNKSQSKNSLLLWDAKSQALEYQSFKMGKGLGA